MEKPAGSSAMPHGGCGFPKATTATMTTRSASNSAEIWFCHEIAWKLSVQSGQNGIMAWL
jgi:hypothetical protein